MSLTLQNLFEKSADQKKRSRHWPSGAKNNAVFKLLFDE